MLEIYVYANGSCLTFNQVLLNFRRRGRVYSEKCYISLIFKCLKIENEERKAFAFPKSKDHKTIKRKEFSDTDTFYSCTAHNPVNIILFRTYFYLQQCSSILSHVTVKPN